jgi:hypothetical protein
MLVSQMPRELLERWKQESANFTRPISAALNTEMLEFALKRDRAINPNLDQYTFLTPQKREEIRLRHYRATPSE